MSNKVILRLLRGLIEDARMTLDTSDFSSLHENHPLIAYIERRLSRMWALSGGLLCPELERRIGETKKRKPEELRELVTRLVEEYYREQEALKPPFQRVPPPPWLRREGERREAEIVI